MVFKQFLSKDVTITPLNLITDYTNKGSQLFVADDIEFFSGKNLEYIDGSVEGTETTGFPGYERYKKSVYDYVNHMYYTVNKYSTGSLYEVSSSYNLNLESDVKINRYFPKDINSEITYIVIPPKNYGNNIVPGTFNLMYNNQLIQDDFEGNLVNNNEHIGNIIYSHGAVIITSGSLRTIGDSICNGQIDNVTMYFKRSFTIYENQYKCVIRDSEYNMTMNPSIISSSFGDIYPHVTGSEFTPYVTQVGLYNDNRELLMIAKLSKPLKMSATTDTVIQINFDL